MNDRVKSLLAENLLQPLAIENIGFGQSEASALQKRLNVPPLEARIVIIVKIVEGHQRVALREQTLAQM
jgi:hypothetical protein